MFLALPEWPQGRCQCPVLSQCWGFWFVGFCFTVTQVFTLALTEQRFTAARGHMNCLLCWDHLKNYHMLHCWSDLTPMVTLNLYLSEKYVLCYLCIHVCLLCVYLDLACCSYVLLQSTPILSMCLSAVNICLTASICPSENRYMATIDPFPYPDKISTRYSRMKSLPSPLFYSVTAHTNTLVWYYKDCGSVELSESL